MNIENLSIEAILANANIQHNLIDLQSGDKEVVRRALGTLTAVTQYGNRKDSLYALIGYYQLEVKTLDDIEFFFNATRNLHSPELIYLILKDLARNREAPRRRLFMKDVLRCFPLVLRTATSKQAESLVQIVESAVWGDKQKARFLESMNYGRGFCSHTASPRSVVDDEMAL
jgi:hypothetical protein